MSSSESIAVVIEQLSRGPAVVINLVHEVPADRLTRRPVPSKWSAHEHACHLAAVQPMFVRRLNLMLNSPEPVIKPFSPAVDDPDGSLLSINLNEAMHRFRSERVELVGRLKELSVDQWDIRAQHPEYVRYSVFIMFRHLALHDLYHAYRIEERLLERLEA